MASSPSTSGRLAHHTTRDQAQSNVPRRVCATLIRVGAPAVVSESAYVAVALLGAMFGRTSMVNPGQVFLGVTGKLAPPA